MMARSSPLKASKNLLSLQLTLEVSDISLERLTLEQDGTCIHR